MGRNNVLGGGSVSSFPARSKLNEHYHLRKALYGDPAPALKLLLRCYNSMEHPGSKMKRTPRTEALQIVHPFL
jgi:hypothetical protein